MVLKSKPEAKKSSWKKYWSDKDKWEEAGKWLLVFATCFPMTILPFAAHKTQDSVNQSAEEQVESFANEHTSINNWQMNKAEDGSLKDSPLPPTGDRVVKVTSGSDHAYVVYNRPDDSSAISNLRMATPKQTETLDNLSGGND